MATTGSTLPLPSLIFQTQKRMDDYSASDMKCGDLTEEQLKRDYGLTDVGAFCENYSMLDFIAQGQIPNANITKWCDPYKMADKKESARILFDQFRKLAKAHALWGDYRWLIQKMINHMQVNSGSKFTDPILDLAMSERILNDSSINSSLLRIKQVLVRKIDWRKGNYPLIEYNRFYDEIMDGRLPKFNDLEDRFNGLGITIHETWATHITLQSLVINGDNFKANVHYRIQDHFGLDDTDIRNSFYKNFRIFRLWFLLQRWGKFGYKPFITEMNATINIEGKRGDVYY